MPKKINWLTEKQASEKLNRHPRYLRSLVKIGKVNISYRKGLNGRDYEYSEGDIEEIKNKTAVLI